MYVWTSHKVEASSGLLESQEKKARQMERINAEWKTKVDLESQ